MGLEALKSTKEIDNFLVQGKVHAVVGDWGGRKFYLGDDKEHLFTLSEFVKKLDALAESDTKKGTVSSNDLKAILRTVKQIDARAHGKVKEKGLVVLMATIFRRVISPHSAQGQIQRFEKNIDKQYNAELELIRKHQDEYSNVLKGVTKIEESNLPKELKKPLKAEELPIAVFLDQRANYHNVSKMHDIHCRLIDGKPINFQEVTQNILNQLKKLDFSRAYSGFDKKRLLENIENRLKTFTNSELDWIHAGLKLVIEKGMTINPVDPGEPISFVSFLSEFPMEDEILRWIASPNKELSDPRTRF